MILFKRFLSVSLFLFFTIGSRNLFALGFVNKDFGVCTGVFIYAASLNLIDGNTGAANINILQLSNIVATRLFYLEKNGKISRLDLSEGDSEFAEIKRDFDRSKSVEEVKIKISSYMQSCYEGPYAFVKKSISKNNEKILFGMRYSELQQLIFDQYRLGLGLGIKN